MKISTLATLALAALSIAAGLLFIAVGATGEPDLAYPNHQHVSTIPNPARR